MKARAYESAETLGDTTPGAFDALDGLEHPALVQARLDTEIGGRGLLVMAIALVATVFISVLQPGVWFAGWLP